MYLYAQNIHATSGFYANGSYSAYGAINVVSDDVSTCYADSSFRNITVQVLEVDLDRHWKEQQTPFSEIGGMYRDMLIVLYIIPLLTIHV